MKTLTVIAGPGRSCPLPASAVRAPTGAQVVLLSSPPVGRAPHPHERIGELELVLTDDRAIAYVRGRLRIGDLVERPPAIQPKAPTMAQAPKETP